MIRTLGVTELLSNAPGVVVVLFALVTQLGDFWFTFLACTLAYLLGSHVPLLGDGLSRERAATVLSLLTLAVALTVSLKTAFALPRPPGADVAAHAELVPAAVRDVYVSMATGHGYGFPSGHATVTAIVWGGFAWALRVGTRRQRVGGRVRFGDSPVSLVRRLQDTSLDHPRERCVRLVVVRVGPLRDGVRVERHARAGDVVADEPVVALLVLPALRTVDAEPLEIVLALDVLGPLGRCLSGRFGGHRGGAVPGDDGPFLD